MAAIKAQRTKSTGTDETQDEKKARLAEELLETAKELRKQAEALEKLAKELLKE